MLRNSIVVAGLILGAFSAKGEIRALTHVTVPVADYDAALAWYTGVLGLEVREDVKDPSMGPDYRWLTVGVPGQPGVNFVLNRKGEPVRGRAAFTIESSDCEADHAALAARGVRFTTPLSEAPWGCFAEFEDLYGNGFLLVESRRP
jgi:catechol 2,3-dioxygenase-like lactoylglutathione lyase family enzyme